LWLMWWTSRSRDSLVAGKTGHVWDGDLEEYNNPLPRWWLGLFILTVVFGAAYLVFYPGLGNFSGLGNWTSIERYEAQMAQQRARFEQRVASLQGKSLHELAGDASAMSTAKNLF